MTKVYPRLERKKLKRMQEGKRPYKTLSERTVFTRVVRQYLGDNSGYNRGVGYILRNLIDDGSVLSTQMVRDPQLRCGRNDVKEVLISPDELKQMLVCLKVDGVDEGKKKIAEAISAGVAFKLKDYDALVRKIAKPANENVVSVDAAGYGLNAPDIQFETIPGMNF